MLNRKLFILVLILFIPLYTYSNPLLDKNVVLENKDLIKEVKEEKLDRKLDARVMSPNADKLKVNASKSCNNSINMMEKRLDVLESNIDKRRKLIEKISLIINKRISNLKSKGMDTSKVETSLQEYLNNTNELLKQREGSMMVLADLTRFDCDGDPQNFRNNLKDFNQRFRNLNLEFNRENNKFRKSVLIELSNLQNKYEDSLNSNAESFINE